MPADTRTGRLAHGLAPGIRSYLAVALALTTLAVIVQWQVVPATGLVRSVYTDAGAAEGPLLAERTAAIDLAFLDRHPEVARQPFRAWWGGFWYLPDERTVDLTVRVEGRVDVLVDGRAVLRSDAVEKADTLSETLTLSKGPHAFVVRYAHASGPMSLSVLQAPSGSTPRAFPSSELFASQRDSAHYARVVGMSWIARFVAAVWLVGAALVLGARAGRRLTTLRPAGDTGRPSPGLSRSAPRTSAQPPPGLADRQTPKQALRDASRAWLRLAALSALVVARPLLDAIARSPEFLVAHEAGPTDILVVVGGLVLLVPALLTVPVLLARLAVRRPQALVESALVGVLMAAFAMQVAKHAGGERAIVAVPLAAVAGVAAAIAYHRTAVVRAIATAASFCLIVIPGLFFATSGVRRLLVPPRGVDGPRPRFADAAVRNGTAVPVVLLVFDETPLVSLLDGERKIDPDLYPAFAGLARDGILFRNATTVSDYTQWAVPAILTGRYPRADESPTAADHTGTLYTLLGGTYRFEVFESATDLCPPDLCPPAFTPRAARLTRLASDLRYVYLHAISTADLARRLPSLSDNWRDFGDLGEWRRGLIEEQRRRRPGLMNRLYADAFLDRVRPGDGQPVFFVLHTLLEHFPHLQLPSGQINATRAAVPAFGSGEAWNQDEWAVAQLYQRHLLELRFVDAFLGRLLDRLRSAGVYRRALVVVTADHGISFEPGTPRRAFSDQAAADIMRVPLIVKLPERTPAAVASTDIGGQHVSDRNAQTIDIAPTIAGVLGIPLPWKADGVSLFDSSGPEPDSKTVFYDGARRSRRFDRSGPDLSAALARKLRTFAGATNSSFAPHPDRFSDLVGRPVSEVRVRPGGGTVEMDYLSRFQEFEGRGEDVAFDVAGRLDEVPPERHQPTYLAVAVNGVVWAVTRTWLSEPRGWQATPPPTVWREGRNDVQVFVIEVDDGGPLLRRCDLRAGSPH